MNTFSIKEMITFGWETFKKRPWFFVVAMSLLFVVQTTLRMMGMIPLLGIGFSLIGGIFVGIGMIRFFLAAHDSTADASFAVLSNIVGFWRYIGAGLLEVTIVGGPIVVAGIVVVISIVSSGSFSSNSTLPTLTLELILLLILVVLLSVGWVLYAGARLSFVRYMVLDAGRGPIEAVRESFRATQYVVGKLILLMLALSLLNVLGALALLVGLLVTVPVSLLAMAHVYRTLCPHASDTVSSVSPSVPTPVPPVPPVQVPVA